jgi:hypothetical protein
MRKKLASVGFVHIIYNGITVRYPAVRHEDAADNQIFNLKVSFALKSLDYNCRSIITATLGRGLLKKKYLVKVKSQA